MKKCLTIMGLCMAVMLLFAGCRTDQGAAATREITDGAGRSVTIPEVVDTVVPVGANAIRYVVYTGGVDRIIGVEDGDTNAPPAKVVSYAYRDQFEKLPVIAAGGSNGTVYEEELIALSPDVILTTYDAEAAEALQTKTGIPVICLTLTDKVFDQTVYDNLTLTGHVLGTEERSDAVIAYMASVADDLARRTQQSAQPVTAYCGAVSFKGAHGIEGTEAGYPPFVQTGVTNVADATGRTGAFDVDLEQILKWNPEYLFFDVANFDLVQEDYARRPAYYNQLDAVQNKRLYAQVAYRYNGTNTELAIANAYYVGKVIYPEAFSDIQIEAKVNEITETMLGRPYYDTLKEAGMAFGQLELGEQ